MDKHERMQKAIELSVQSTTEAWRIEHWLYLVGDNVEVVKLAIKADIRGVSNGANVIILYLKELERVEP